MKNENIADQAASDSNANQQKGDFDIMASSAEKSSFDLAALIKNPLAIVAALGIVVMSGFGFLVAICAMVVFTSGSNESASSFSQWQTAPSFQDFEGESGMVHGTFDQQDIRNSVISVDGEVLNLPN